MRSIGRVNPDLATKFPLERIVEICQRYGVSELSVYGPILESDVHKDVKALFLIEFLDDDFGPWGCKLDQVENDLVRRLTSQSARRVPRRSPAEHSIPKA